jgi:hypothetical protein
VVADGGTGVSSLTAYAVMCGGTTSTGAVQSIAGVGTSGQVLTSNGAGALPTFQTAAAPAVNQGITLHYNFEQAVGSTGKIKDESASSGTLALSGGGWLGTTSATNSGRAIAQLSSSGTKQLDYDDSPVFQAVMNLGAVPGSWAGLWFLSLSYSGLPTLNVDVAKHIAFMGSTVAAAETNVASNADGTTQTSTTVTIGTGNQNFLKMKYTTGTNIVYSVNGTTVATHTTNMPTGGFENAAYEGYVYMRNGAATAISRTYVISQVDITFPNA